jgi:sulfopyruvate decarboxylase subunit beta
MYAPEEELISILKGSGIDFTASLPCEKIKVLLELLPGNFFHVPLTREEEGVGICAGAALAGKRPAIFVQSSGIGNMINALLSLTAFYELPLAIFVSRRGIYKEKIAAQIPMGLRLPKILRGAGIPCSDIDSQGDFRIIEQKLRGVYKKYRMHAFLLSPAIWEGSDAVSTPDAGKIPVVCMVPDQKRKAVHPEFTRYEILEMISPCLEGKAVVCNLGIPSKELYAIKHQPSNFYMLGSMGMATPIGLGISISSKKEVVVIDGDGSLLMNPGTLATTAHFSPENLTILAIDNGAYGSTGSQSTLTGSCVDLELVARGFGIGNTAKVAGKEEIEGCMTISQKGPRFIHALALPGNKDVPNIPVGHRAVKKQVQEFLSG